jgi:hypothetical protein
MPLKEWDRFAAGCSADNFVTLKPHLVIAIALLAERFTRNNPLIVAAMPVIPDFIQTEA